MNIAELFVRVRADTSDVDRRLKSVDKSLGNLSTQAKTATLSTGRLGNQFASLASQIAHVHPIVGNLAGVLGNFAVGGLATAGVLAGVAAMAVVWDRFTKATREAKKANDELVSSLEKSNFMASLGPEPGLVLETNNQRNNLRAQQQQRRKLLAFGVDADDKRILDLNVQILHTQTQLALGEKRLFDARMAAGKGLETVEIKGTKLKDTYMQLRNEIEKTRRAVEEEGRAWWMNYAMKAAADEQLTKSMAALLLPGPIDVNRPGGAVLRDFGTTVSNVAPEDFLTDAESKALKTLIPNADKNTQIMKNAIGQSAQIIASSISQALNIGGGGRGSAIGGAAGSALGMGFGATISTLGWAGGPIGGIVGGLLGSAIGGLFDSKKAVNENTSALRMLTATILNAPGGFRVEPYRYRASDPRQLARDLRRYQTRGGAPLLAGIR